MALIILMWMNVPSGFMVNTPEDNIMAAAEMGVAMAFSIFRISPALAAKTRTLQEQVCWRRAGRQNCRHHWWGKIGSSLPVAGVGMTVVG